MFGNATTDDNDSQASDKHAPWNYPESEPSSDEEQEDQNA
jgi:hypothetical protein